MVNNDEKLLARRIKSHNLIEPDFGPKLCSCGHLDFGFVTLVNAWQWNELEMTSWTRIPGRFFICQIENVLFNLNGSMKPIIFS